MDADLARFGFAPLRRDAERESVEIEPDNATAAEVFFLCSTQWRMSFAGPVGLDYSAVHAVMSIRAVPDMADCFERVRAIEYASLGEMAKKSKAAESGGRQGGNRRTAAKR